MSAASRAAAPLPHAAAPPRRWRPRRRLLWRLSGWQPPHAAQPARDRALDANACCDLVDVSQRFVLLAALRKVLLALVVRLETAAITQRRPLARRLAEPLGHILALRCMAYFFTKARLCGVNAGRGKLAAPCVAVLWNAHAKVCKTLAFYQTQNLAFVCGVQGVRSLSGSISLCCRRRSTQDPR